MKINLALTSYDGDQFRILRLIDAAAEMARLLVDAPGVFEGVTGLHDHKGSLEVTVSQDEPSPLLKIVVRDTWYRIGKEDPSQVSFIPQDTSAHLEVSF